MNIIEIIAQIILFVALAGLWWANRQRAKIINTLLNLSKETIENNERLIIENMALKSGLRPSGEDWKKLIALSESIAHWKRLVTGNRRKGECIGPERCALCKQYRLVDPEPCQKCPVKLKTGKPHCIGTPYDEVDDLVEDISSFDTPEFKEAAIKELMFLEGLREDMFRELRNSSKISDQVDGLTGSTTEPIQTNKPKEKA